MGKPHMMLALYFGQGVLLDAKREEEGRQTTVYGVKLSDEAQEWLDSLLGQAENYLDLSHIFREHIWKFGFKGTKLFDGDAKLTCDFLESLAQQYSRTP